MNLLANTKLLTLASLLSVATGVAAAMHLKDFAWLARSGAIVVGLGIVCLSRTFILGKDLLIHVGPGEHDNLNLNGPEHYEVRGEQIPHYVAEDVRSRFALGVAGPAMSFIGTIIWGFADLLNKLFTGFGAPGA